MRDSAGCPAEQDFSRGGVDGFCIPHQCQAGGFAARVELDAQGLESAGVGVAVNEPDYKGHQPMHACATHGQHAFDYTATVACHGDPTQKPTRDLLEKMPSFRLLAITRLVT